MNLDRLFEDLEAQLSPSVVKTSNRRDFYAQARVVSVLVGELRLRLNNLMFGRDFVVGTRRSQTLLVPWSAIGSLELLPASVAEPPSLVTRTTACEWLESLPSGILVGVQTKTGPAVALGRLLWTHRCDLAVTAPMDSSTLVVPWQAVAWLTLSLVDNQNTSNTL